MVAMQPETWVTIKLIQITLSVSPILTITVDDSSQHKIANSETTYT